MRCCHIFVTATLLLTSFNSFANPSLSLQQRAIAESVGYAIEGKLNRKGHKALYGLVDRRALADRVFQGLPGNTKQRVQQRDDLNAYLQSFAVLLSGGLDNNGQIRWQFEGVHADSISPDSLMLTLRMTLPKFGVFKYFGLLIEDVDAARPIVDVYYFQTKVLFSTRLREALSLPMMLKPELSDQYREFLAAYHALDRDKLRQLYPELPKFLQQTPQALLGYLSYAVFGTATERGAAYATLHKHLGNKPEWDPAMLGHYLFSKQYEQALAAVQTLFQRIGSPQASEHGMRAYIHYLAGDYPKALRDAQLGLQLDPFLDLNYNHLASTYIAIGEYDRAVAVLDTLYHRFGQKWDRDSFALYEGKAGLAEFLDSKSYKSWLSTFEQSVAPSIKSLLTGD